MEPGTFAASRTTIPPRRLTFPAVAAPAPPTNRSTISAVHSYCQLPRSIRLTHHRAPRPPTAPHPPQITGSETTTNYIGVTVTAAFRALMAASASSLLAAPASSSCGAISPQLPRGAPAAASVASPSRHSCYLLRASPSRRHRSRFVANAAPTMQPPAESRVSTVVDVDLGDRSYPIYIGAGLLDEPDLLQRQSNYTFFL